MVKLKAKRILVVEDEQVIANLCLRVLGKEGFEVDVAQDGGEAQGKIEASQYDLLFIDLRLPKVSGEELYAWLLQEHPQLANRVAFTTGSVMVGEMKIFLEQSGRPYLLKPFEVSELRAFIKETLERLES